MKYLFNKVAIVGVGLLGGSLGLALKKRRLVRSVVGLGRNQQRLDRAVRKQAIDAYYLEPEWQSAVNDTELVVICTPVGDIVRIAKQLCRWLPAGSIITDVGSTKQSIVQQMDSFLKRERFPVYFVGSHPMAGSDQTGVEAAQADLFNRAVCIITPTKYTAEPAIQKVSQLWKSVGGNIIFLAPSRHDRYVAAISHLPHLVAASLVNSIEQVNRKDTTVLQLAAGGYKDTTRIASSSPELWRDICLENKTSIVSVLKLFEKELTRMKRAIETADSREIYHCFIQAKKARDKIK
ncbi:MAG: prephenate dehydrogenase [bacterium]|nr:prephenate dehydrogenase [bacterium]